VFIDDDHETLRRRVVAPDAGIIGKTEAIVRGVEESLEHHEVQYTGEIPLGVAM
jgi:hypothetical protein